MGGCPTRETPRVPFLQWSPARPPPSAPPPSTPRSHPCTPHTPRPAALHPLPPQSRLAGELAPCCCPAAAGARAKISARVVDHMWIRRLVGIGCVKRSLYVSPLLKHDRETVH